MPGEPENDNEQLEETRGPGAGKARTARAADPEELACSPWVGLHYVTEGA